MICLSKTGSDCLNAPLKCCRQSFWVANRKNCYFKVDVYMHVLPHLNTGLVVVIKKQVGSKKGMLF